MDMKASVPWMKTATHGHTHPSEWKEGQRAQIKSPPGGPLLKGQ